MTRILILAIYLLSTTALASDLEDRESCIKMLKRFQSEKWCDSEDRKECLPLHGAEWCDGSVVSEMESKTVDKQLNDTYKRLLQKATERQRKSIRESQRAWLQYRTLECTARNDMIDGGDAVMRSNVWTGCQTEFSKSRIKEFEREYCSSFDRGC